MCVVTGVSRTANEHKSYLCSCFFENSVTKDPERRKPWKRKRERERENNRKAILRWTQDL